MNKEYIDLVQWIADFAKKNGADEISATISIDNGFEIDYREGKIEKFEQAKSKSLLLRIYTQNKYSAHFTNDLRKSELEKFIKEAIVSTKYLSVDIFRKLPDNKYYPKDLGADLNLFDNNYLNINAKTKVDIVKQIEEYANRISKNIISTTASYSDSLEEFVMLNSNGFLGEGGGTIFSVSAEVTVNDNDKGRPEDFSYASVRFFNDLPSPELLGAEAANRALSKIGQAKIASGRYTMVVENRTAARLLGYFFGPMSARSIQQKASWLEGKINTKVASDKLTVIDDPFISKGLSSRKFDNEGMNLCKRTLIESGVLRTYLVDSYYGRKLGIEPNSGTLSNILMELGSRSKDEIISDIVKGIYVTSFLGGNYNSTTGDFSTGIVGFLIENGKFKMPVNEMNISGNTFELWNSLVEIGNDPFPYSGYKIPTLVFENCNFSGI